MKRVKTKRSGINGYQCRLQDSYDNYQQFKALAEMYGIHTRLGYKTVKGAWQRNPMVEGSVIPADLRKVET